MNPLTKSIRIVTKRKFPFPKMQEVIIYAENFGIQSAASKYGCSPLTIKAWIAEKDFIVEMSDPEKLNDLKLQQQIVVKERERMRKLLWQQKNKPKRDAKVKRQWYQENKSHILDKEKNRKRRCIFQTRSSITNANARKKDNFDKIVAWDLWKIAKRQKLKCPFTMIKLNAENMSVDHIIPFSKGGINHPSNIRLVHKWVNKMRLDYPDEDFINICNLVASIHPRQIPSDPS